MELWPPGELPARVPRLLGSQALWPPRGSSPGRLYTELERGWQTLSGVAAQAPSCLVLPSSLLFRGVRPATLLGDCPCLLPPPLPSSSTGTPHPVSCTSRSALASPRTWADPGGLRAGSASGELFGIPDVLSWRTCFEGHRGIRLTTSLRPHLGKVLNTPLRKAKFI